MIFSLDCVGSPDSVALLASDTLSFTFVPGKNTSVYLSHLQIEKKIL